MELALPITVYWDLAPDAPTDDVLLRCCDEILDCRPLMLQLNDPSTVQSKAAGAILERFRDTPVAVSFTAPHSCIASLNRVRFDQYAVKELLLALDDPDTLHSTLPSIVTGISFSVKRENWRRLPAVVALCRERGLNRLVLPMQRIYTATEPFQLDRSEQKTLEDALAVAGGTEGLRLTIHDPFLWRAFNPEVPFPQGGCQAANTMIAIAPDGGVYPCPTLPVLLGRIGMVPLKEILTSPAKKELRGSIRRNPVDCGNCSEVAVCRGGCRGRSYVTYGTFDRIDDACR